MDKTCLSFFYRLYSTIEDMERDVKKSGKYKRDVVWSQWRAIRKKRSRDGKAVSASWNLSLLPYGYSFFYWPLQHCATLTA
jgi:hypothetical protein